MPIPPRHYTLVGPLWSRFEEALQQSGASGSTAEQQINSLKRRLSAEQIRRMHYVRLQRNALQHAHPRALSDPDKWSGGDRGHQHPRATQKPLWGRGHTGLGAVAARWRRVVHRAERRTAYQHPGARDRGRPVLSHLHVKQALKHLGMKKRRRCGVVPVPHPTKHLHMRLSDFILRFTGHSASELSARPWAIWQRRLALGTFRSLDPPCSARSFWAWPSRALTRRVTGGGWWLDLPQSCTSGRPDGVRFAVRRQRRARVAAGLMGAHPLSWVVTAFSPSQWTGGDCRRSPACGDRPSPHRSQPGHQVKARSGA